MVSDLHKSFKIFSHDNCNGWWFNKLVQYLQSTPFFSATQQHSISQVVIYTNIIVWVEGKKHSSQKCMDLHKWLVGATKCKTN
jgi:hypothetical protein